MLTFAETASIGFVVLQAVVWIAIVVYLIGLTRRLVLAQERTAGAIERLTEVLRANPRA